MAREKFTRQHYGRNNQHQPNHRQAEWDKVADVVIEGEMPQKRQGKSTAFAMHSNNYSCRDRQYQEAPAQR